MKGWLATAVLAAATVAGTVSAQPAGLSDAELRERLRQWELQQAESDTVQCAPLDGEASRFAAAEDLPLIEVSLGDHLDALVERFPDYFDFYEPDDLLAYTSDMMRLAVDVGGERIESKTGGMHNVVAMFGASYGRNQVHSIEFYDQQCPVILEVALARAHALEAKLASAGFEPEPALIAFEEYGGLASATFENWDAGAAVLGRTPRIMAAVSSRWSRGEQEATVSVWNWGAREPEQQSREILGKLQLEFLGSVFEGDGSGRKYGVQFRIADDSIFRAGFDQLDAEAGPGK